MIRRAQIKDLEQINRLLYQVHKVHSDIRNDIFKPGKKKYQDNELIDLIKNDLKPIFVFADENDVVQGYCFTVIQITKNEYSLMDRKTLYIDDLCVDENYRNHHIGKQLYEYVVNYAKNNDFDAVTLNVWQGNDSALAFYQKCGFKTLKTTMEIKLN